MINETFSGKVSRQFDLSRGTVSTLVISISVLLLGLTVSVVVIDCIASVVRNFPL